MEKRRIYTVLSLALLFFTILGLNIWVHKSIGHTNTVIEKTVIEHAQLEFFVPGKRILMQANISDPAGIAEARLYFGTSKDAKNLVFSKMKPQGNGHVGIIPAPSSNTEKIFYCFLAVNNNGDVVKTGLFELQANKNVGFVPTWQGDFNEYSKTLILGKESPSEPLSNVIASEAKQSLYLEGFTDSIIVNSVKPDERYFAAKKVERVPGLSTIDGGNVESPEGGWSKNKKIAVIGGAVGAGALAAIIAGTSGGGGGGGGGGGTTTTTTTTTTTPTTLPVIQIPPKTGIPPTEITFNPNIGQPGEPVNNVDICLDPVINDSGIGFGSGWNLRVFVDGEKKEFSGGEGDPCSTIGPCGIKCQLNNLFEFSDDGNHNIVMFLNVESRGAVKILDEPLAIKFKD